jgi:Zn-dependent protease
MSSQFAPKEPRDILIAWIVLTLALSFRSLIDLVQGVDPLANLQFLVAAAIAGATGFILHEMGHKFVAVRYGYVAHFQVWRSGLFLLIVTAVISSLFGTFFLFGAPGAVYITPGAAAGYYGYGYYSTNYRQQNPERENTRISAAGPGLNLLFAFLFLIVLLVPSSYFVTLVATDGLYLNLILGAFNMLPVPPLDGYKIFRGNLLLALAIALPLWAGALYLFLIG